MTQTPSILSGFTAAILLATAWSCALGVDAQNAFVTSKVTSCIADLQNNSLIVSTGQSDVVTAPTLQYLPGPGGNTVLVADFAGLLWNGEPKIIRGERPGIEEIRIGQFQENPPICRVSLTSRNPNLFKLVNFRTQAGQMIVSWSNDSAAADLLASKASISSPKARKPTPYVSKKPALPKPASRGRAPIIPRIAGATDAKDDSATQIALPTSSIPSDTLPSFHSTIKLTANTGEKKSEEGKGGQTLPPTDSYKDLANQASTATTDTKDKTSTGKKIMTKLLAHVPPAVTTAVTNNLKDLKSHDKLTKADPAAQQASQTTATMKNSSPAKSNGKDMSDSQPDEQKFTLSMPQSNQPNVPALPEGAAPSQPMKMTLSTDEGSVVDNLKVEMIAQRKINYKTFRMHDPERYVIDFTDMPEVQTLALPDSESSLFYRFRSGKLPSNPKVSRFVIDLPEEDVSVADVYDDANNKLILLLTKALKTAKTEDIRPLKVDISQPPNPDDGPISSVETPSTDGQSGFNTPPTGRKKLPGAVTIVLDAGHGGSDPGAQREGIQEKDITLAITKKLKTLLERQGAEVIMTRNDDTFVSLEDRAKITNDNVPDLFMSVHINALESTADIHGIETYYQTDQSKPLAETIHQALVGDLTAPDRSVRKARFYVINHTVVPAILAEVGFISNKDERQRLTTSDYQDKIAAALARGVSVWITQTPVTTPVAQGGTRSPMRSSFATVGSSGTRGDLTKSSSASSVNSVSSLNRLVK